MATSNEGNILAGNACGGCDNDNVTMHCEECPIYLCDNCAKYHKRMPATAVHELKSVCISTESFPRSGNMETLSISCAFHSGFPITLVCKTCKEVICESCKPQHEGHKLVRAKSDVQLLQQIAVEEISRLLKQVQELDQKKIALQDCLTVYKDAKKRVEEWRRIIVDCANKGADGLNNLLDQKIRDVEKLKCEDLGDCSAKCDQQVSLLNSIKRTKDASTLIGRITESTHFTHKARRMLELILLETFSINGILPNEKILDAITDNTKLLFTGEMIKDRPCVEYSTQKEQHDSVLPDKVIWHIAETTELKGPDVILYSRKSTKVIRFHLETFTQNLQMCPTDIDKLLCFSQDKYILQEYLKPCFHLLDHEFKITHSLRQEDTDHIYEYSDICIYGHNTFLQVIPFSQNLYKRLFRKVSFSNGKFESSDISVVLLPEIPSYITLLNSRQHVYIVSSRESDRKHLLLKINLLTSKIKTNDVSKHMSKKVWSLYADADANAIIGDYSGAIHMYSPDLNHKVIQNTQDSVYGITMRKGKLVVSSGYPPHIKIFG